MTSLTRFIGTLKSVYQNINPSTLTGAIDVIVVKQEDGSLRGTPFHVRFGKLDVLQNQHNEVDIMINGIPVKDLRMELGEAGEAVFIEENQIENDSSPNRHLEPSNQNSFFDPDHALPVSGDDHPQLSNIDCSPQIINKQLDIEKAEETNQPAPTYAFDHPAPIPTDLNVGTSSTARRHPKRRTTNRTEQNDELSSGDDDAEVQGIMSLGKRRSRTRKRQIPVESERSSGHHSSDEQAISPATVPVRRRSASETDIPFFQIDDDEESQPSTPFVDAHSRLNSIDSRKRSLRTGTVSSINKTQQVADDDSYGSSQEDNIDLLQLPARTDRAMSNPIPIEQPTKNEPMSSIEESSTLLNAFISQSAPIGAPITTMTHPISIPKKETNESATSDFINDDFSPSSAPSNSPKSDTEYELEKSNQQSSIKKQSGLGWTWKWGEFPEPQNRIIRFLWPSSSSSKSTAVKKSTPNEGMYLDDITNNRCDDRTKYLPNFDYLQHQPKSPKDEDQESGKGNSIPHSPVREHETSYIPRDIQFSLCGKQYKPSEITEYIFNAHLISNETFDSNPSIISDPNLIVRIGGIYYDWNVASSLIASACTSTKQSLAETMEQFPEKTSSPTKSTSSNSYWNLFSSRKPVMTDEQSKSIAMEALAFAVKSEVSGPIFDKPELIRKYSDDSEQEYSEQKKIIEPVQTPIVPNKPTVKKTLILTSDQLKRLNLKSGMNQVAFSVTTAIQGTTVIEANIFFFDHLTKFVISDIDGTITKSDVFGHLFPLVGKDWSHDGIAQFFKAIQENGYQFIYLSARAIGQSRITRNFLRSIKQCGFALPDGPLLISPDTLVTALYREVIAKRPEEFKIECLKNIASLFPNKNPFYAGFGNRINDQQAYTAVGIPVTRIFTINPRGEVVRQKISQVLSTSYKNLHEVVDQIFPPMDCLAAGETYSSFTFWRPEVPISDALENEMLEHLQEIAAQKNTKGRKSTSSKVTPTTTVTKSDGGKLITLAQATENTVKKP